jgi:sulfur-oxidizing protein SoxX
MRARIAIGPLLAAVLVLPCAAQGPAAPQAFVSKEKGHCIACHQVPEGAGPRTRADLGPALTGERMRALGRERIRAIIEDPTRANPETVMPPFGRHRILDAAEIRALVEYLHALP